MTKGMEVARSFFQGWGLPYLRADSPELVERVAAVVCGGSQCLGNDDELSRDHGWGPHLTLILIGGHSKPINLILTVTELLGTFLTLLRLRIL